MEVTRRYWVVVAVLVALCAWAFVLERPVMLVGAGTIGAWLLTRQYRFISSTNDTIDSLSVDQDLDRTRLTAEETTVGRLTARTTHPVDVHVKVQTQPPIGSDGGSTSSSLAPGETRSQESFTLSWPIAGQFEFDEPVVTVTDSLDLFRVTTTRGTTPTVTVEPRAPRDIHVGEGGEQLAAGFGEHSTGKTGSGLTPAEVRRYVAGDSAHQIDWKATARLNEPHVREFEAETDLETALFVDHRATMATGRDGETKLDYARQLALALVENAMELGDPLGWYSIGDGGIAHRAEPNADESHYRTISQQLRALEPTSSTTDAQSAEPMDPAHARRTANHLTDDSPFSTKLQPFFAAGDQYVQRVADQPLFAGLRTAAVRLDGSVRTIIITDDEHPTELREAVKVARRGNGQVVVFLTPSVLYDLDTLGDLDDAYRRYTAFEEFRRELAALERVSAFEVGPSDRLSAVLSAGNQRRRVEQ